MIWPDLFREYTQENETGRTLHELTGNSIKDKNYIVKYKVILYTFSMKYHHLDRKKQELDKHRPLPSALAESLEQWFRIELTYTSNAIEGNTLTRQETAVIVEKGLAVGGKSLVEHLEATNHAAALDWIKHIVAKPAHIITEQDVLAIHGLILKGIDDTNAGRYRSVAVRISGSAVVLPNPRKIPDLMAEFGTWLALAGNMHPVELASEAHYRLVTIHPFADGNGRTARLLMNLILWQHGYPPALIRKRDRLAYISALEKAQLGGSKEDYETVIVKAVDRSLDIYLKAVQGDDRQPVQKNTLLTIGRLAKQAGETVPTIRHWTAQGLIQAEDRTESGYMLYSPDTLGHIDRIKQLKSKRHTLEEIKQIMNAKKASIN